MEVCQSTHYGHHLGFLLCNPNHQESHLFGVGRGGGKCASLKTFLDVLLMVVGIHLFHFRPLVCCTLLYILTCFLTLAVGKLPHPGTTSVSFLDLCHHLHPGWSSQFSHPSGRPLQIHPEEMLQAERLQWQHSGHYLCQNTNEWQNEVLDSFNLYLITKYLIKYGYEIKIWT